MHASLATNTFLALTGDRFGREPDGHRGDGDKYHAEMDSFSRDSRESMQSRMQSRGYGEKGRAMEEYRDHNAFAGGLGEYIDS